MKKPDEIGKTANVKEAQSRRFELFWRRTNLPLN